MGLIGLNNLNALKAKTTAQRARIKQKGADFVQMKVRAVLKDALKASPQWSGNYAANWVIETNQTGPSNYTGKFKVKDWRSLQKPWKAKQAGDKQAIDWAYKYINEETIKALRYNSIVRLRNYAPVAEKIENGEVELRPENKVLIGDLGVIEYLKMKHKFLR